jgi:serine/threonine protein kinase/tetratricopeptide (TPR) repeat protein
MLSCVSHGRRRAPPLALRQRRAAPRSALAAGNAHPVSAPIDAKKSEGERALSESPPSAIPLSGGVSLESGDAPTLIAPVSGELLTGAALSTMNGVTSSGPSGQVLGGRYEILGLVGVGGMGSVYRARDRELEEVVALKVLRRELVDKPGMLDRFRREVKLARRVTHRNVARVFDIGEHQGEKFLTMELVDGESLAALMSREGRLPVARAVEIALAICAGLSSAHGAGVVHRDLKPDNVLLARDGRVVITDFGIARAFADAAGAVNTMGMLLGTPAYMAPEQVEGHQDIDGRADIYALGALLYELFTGERAWPGDSPFGVAAARLLAPPPDPRARRPDLPTSCGLIVLRCMARKRDDRFASVDHVSLELGTLTLPVISSRPPPSPAPLQAASPAPSATDKTVAVLPFRNAGPPEDDYLAEELTDDLIDGLSMTARLKVRARGAVLRYRDAEMDPRDIGRELAVQVVVEGSVRRARGNVRVSARLISVADGFQLWAKRFDRPEQEVLSINDDAARAIAEALTLDREEQKRDAPSNPLAIDLYLRARHEYRKFWIDHQKKALELLDQAVALAPDDPMILAGKAMVMSRISFFHGKGLSEVRAVAERAVSVAPNLGEARLALGSAMLQAADFEGAIRELRHAVARGPGLAEAHSALGRLLAEVGPIDEAIHSLETALAIDRDAPMAHDALVRCCALKRDFARVDEEMNKILEIQGRSAYVVIAARMMLWRRDRDRASAILEEFEAEQKQIGFPSILLELVSHAQLPFDAAAIRSIAKNAEGGARRKAFFLQLEAEIFAFLGQLEPVWEALGHAAESELIDVCWIDNCPLFDELRHDPRFAPIRASVKRRADAIQAAYRSP